MSLYQSSSESSRTLHIGEKWLIFFTLLTVLTILALVFGVLAFVNDTASLNGNSTRGTSSVDTYVLKYEPDVGSLPEPATLNTYVTRYLNKVVTTATQPVTLANNEFMVRAGTWSISVAAPVYRAGANLLRLYNVSTGAVEAQGQSSWSTTTGGQGDQVIANLSHTWKVRGTTGTQTYRIEHYVNSSNGADFTFGNPVAESTGAGLTKEVYTTVMLQRLQ